MISLDEESKFDIVGIYDLQVLRKKITEQRNQMIPPVRAVKSFMRDGEK